MFRNVYAVIFAFFAVITMAFSGVAVGFASASPSYTAATISTGNSISSDYFTAGLYKYTGEETISNVIEFNETNFTPLTVTPFNQGELPYRSENSTCSITNGSANCTISDVFIAISNSSNHTSSDNTYSVSCEVTGLLDGMTCDANLVCGDGDDTITVNMAYRIFLNLRNVNYTGNTSQPAPMTLTVTITITDNNSASYCSTGNTVSFRLSTTVDDFKEELDDVNTSLDGVEFYPDSSGDPPGVYIQNENSNNNSIANEDSGKSDIDVTITVPSGIYFCVYVHIDAGGYLSTETSEVSIHITKIDNNGALLKDYGSGKVASRSYFIITPAVDRYVYLSSDKVFVPNNTNKPGNNNNNFFHCNSGERLQIEFTGEQDSSWMNTLTVSAKLVQKGDLYP